MTITTWKTGETGVVDDDGAGDGDVTVVRVSGELDIRAAPELRGVLRGLLRHDGDAGAPRVVVDLREVTFMDSTALGVLVQAYKTARAHRRTFALVSTSPRVAALFRVTAMQHVMPLHPDVPTALGRTAPARAG
ncbi:anti-sigma B factor antagonist [Quadrisphaera granulorum]|uniref:Anti-sigma factor antagonist n=1 Tax=Quadrisphaera granulorum TaxID=317664 RepID=A0A315ZRM0_9ACTN|nr:STAS domain-containing protein [Quadrisphaera granulorum]PWJ48175.1 anti-sigma B factor antagonist [Quadrisphaera granulorum]SZE98544.1 anti-sigma B factor antagonist [Quadrisphaera granulorum]